MFLLFLIGLGTADVNAQVRIGGNAAPNGAAVLDLNATDAATGTKGLALPRVRLDSATVQITPGVANLNGMLVYNTTATLGAGIYSWISGVWKRVDSAPNPITTDSGRFLMSDGKGGTRWAAIVSTPVNNVDSIKTTYPRSITGWLQIVDTSLNVQFRGNNNIRIYIAGVAAGDLCYSGILGNYVIAWASTNLVALATLNQVNTYSMARIICLRHIL